MKKVQKKKLAVKKDIREMNIALTLVGAILIFSAGFLLWKNREKNILPSFNLSQKNEDAFLAPPPCDFRSRLDGACVASSTAATPPVVAVMVENHLEAQPLAGIAEASVVYEAPVEGNFPRFLALYPADEPVKKVGPVRSARPYYLDWVSEWGDAMYMHVGGSDEALRKIRQFGLFGINEFFYGRFFWRDHSRHAPHNTYTSTDLWTAAKQEARARRTEDPYAGWNFDESAKCMTSCTTTLSLSFLAGVYDIEWKYNIEQGVYERWQNKEKQADENSDVYVANNVIVQHVKAVVLDEVGRRRITTVGEGKTEFFIEGKFMAGKWKKVSREAPTQWFDELGNEVILAPGKTWVEIVAKNMTVKWE